VTKTISSKSLWIDNKTPEDIKYFSKEDSDNVVYNLQEDILCLKDIIVAHQIADKTGYIDGVGWVENWSEMEETVTKLVEAHNLVQHDKGVDKAIAELTICYRVALDEHKDYEDAEVLEGLIDSLQALKDLS
jgi:hypothetical protein